jgi:hypothetical protein
MDVVCARNAHDKRCRDLDCRGVPDTTVKTMIKSAIISECGTYRYSLVREWEQGPRVLWIMLNPSVADASIDDPTIRRCIGFSKVWDFPMLRFGSMEVVNLFAYRATDPKDMAAAKALGVDIVGPENDLRITEAASRASLVVAAWGADKLAPLRSVGIRKLIAPHQLMALGKSKSGAPKHPLYLPSSAELILI